MAVKLIPEPLQYTQDGPNTLEAKRRRMSRSRFPDAPANGQCFNCNGLCEVRTVVLRTPDEEQLVALRTEPDMPVTLLRVEGLYCHPCATFRALSPGTPIALEDQ